jgi:hypothetical protein
MNREIRSRQIAKNCRLLALGGGGFLRFSFDHSALLSDAIKWL